MQSYTSDIRIPPRGWSATKLGNGFCIHHGRSNNSWWTEYDFASAQEAFASVPDLIARSPFPDVVVRGTAYRKSSGLR